MAEMRDAYVDEWSSSEVFGYIDGKLGYHQLVEMFPHRADESVSHLAERAVRNAMIAKGRFDIDIDMATNAVITSLENEVPAVRG